MAYSKIRQPKLSDVIEQQLEFLILEGTLRPGEKSSLAILPSFLSYAESYFNPAFLLENGTSVADLSRFERGNHQPAGVYRVDLWRNDEFIGSQDIVFESTTENTGDKPPGEFAC